MSGLPDFIHLQLNNTGQVNLRYATPEVRMLRIARKAGDAAVAPTVENTLTHTYPIARPLFMYTLGEPTGVVKEYMDWVRSDAGQKIVVESGYVPLPKTGARP